MTLTTNARVAGVTFLVYIAAGMASMAGVSGALVGVVLSLIMCLSAIVLAVTLYGITRDADADIAMLGLTFRVGEGLLGAASMPLTLALRSMGTGTALESWLHDVRGFNVLVCATFFAAGSTLFCYLFLRGRMIPRFLAWLGLAASILLVIALPLQLGGVLHGPLTQVVWLPMLAFEVPLALWLIIKGVAPVTGRAR